MFFDVCLNSGDLIFVFENICYYFIFQEDCKVVVVRIFVIIEGWVLIYEKDSVN